MSRLTPRQREVLQKRVALALGWNSLVQYQRDAANQSAKVVVDAIEDAQFSSMALRRGVDAVIRSLDEKREQSA